MGTKFDVEQAIERVGLHKMKIGKTDITAEEQYALDESQRRAMNISLDEYLGLISQMNRLEKIGDTVVYPDVTNRRSGPLYLGMISEKKDFSPVQFRPTADRK